MKDIAKVLITAIATEKYGQQFYEQLSQSIDDAEGIALMKGLAKDEKEHEELLANEYKRLFNTTAPVDDKDKDNIAVNAITKIFGKDERKKLEKGDIFESLELGIKIEQRSIEFYSSGGEATEDQALQKLFANLVEIEKGHKSLLEENLFHLKQNGSWWGYVPILEG